jgi:drug/metabolite transporter (DMT)-like permease
VPRPNPHLCAVVVFWGFNYVAMKVVYPEMGAPVVGLLRALIIQALLVVWCLIRKEPLRYEKGDAWRVLGTGCLSMGIYMVAFLEGVARTTASDGAIVMASGTLMTYLLACLLGQERFLGGAMAGSAVSFGGVALIIVGGASTGHGTVGGNLLMLLAATLWALSTVASKPIVHAYAPIRMFALSLPGALPVLLVYGAVPTLQQDYASISARGWAMFASVVLGSGLFAFALFYEGLRQVGAARASFYNYFVPVLAVLFSWAILGIAPTLLQVVGLATVLGGVALANAARQRAAAQVNSAV